jgi:DNA repair protein RecO (recombination protein O)
MLTTTEGIVLSSLRYNESDLIVKCYTKSHGILSFMVKGVLKSKRGKFKASYFQVFSLLSIHCQVKNKDQLNYFKDVQPSIHLTSIQSNVYKGTLAMFLSEVIKSVIYEEEQNEDLFDFIYEGISWLEVSDNFSNYHIAFLVKLSLFIGFYPNFKNDYDETYFDIRDGHFLAYEDKYCLNEEYSALLKQLILLDLKDCHSLKINKIQRMKMLEILLHYYELHVESFRTPKSLEVLKQIFN